MNKKNAIPSKTENIAKIRKRVNSFFHEKIEMIRYLQGFWWLKHADVETEHFN